MLLENGQMNPIKQKVKKVDSNDAIGQIVTTIKRQVY